MDSSTTLRAAPAATPEVLAAGLVVLAVLLGVVLAVVLGGALRRSRARQRRLEQELADARAEVSSLGARLEELAARVSAPGPDGSEAPGPHEERPGYVITSLRDQPGSDPVPATGPTVSAGQFASAAVGESLVRLLSLSYGVRRALSAESRNRIRFEVRREVRRSRKQRKHDVRAAKRHLRTEEAA